MSNTVETGTTGRVNIDVAKKIVAGQEADIGKLFEGVDQKTLDEAEQSLAKFNPDTKPDGEVDVGELGLLLTNVPGGKIFAKPSKEIVDAMMNGLSPEQQEEMLKKMELMKVAKKGDYIPEGSIMRDSNAPTHLPNEMNIDTATLRRALFDGEKKTWNDIFQGPEDNKKALFEKMGIKADEAVNQESFKKAFEGHAKDIFGAVDEEMSYTDGTKKIENVPNNALMVDFVHNLTDYDNNHGELTREEKAKRYTGLDINHVMYGAFTHNVGKMLPQGTSGSDAGQVMNSVETMNAAAAAGTMRVASSQ